MTTEVTDIWFRSTLKLEEIARRLGMKDVLVDCEDHWAWVIGSLGELELDITRTHTRPASRVDTRIFLPGGLSFTETLIAELVGRLQAFVAGRIYCGQWVPITGNKFDLVVVREFRRGNGTKFAPP